MKLILSMFSLLLVMGFAGLFVLKKPDGSPWLSWQEMLPDLSIDSVKTTVTDALPTQTLGGGDSDAVTVYRWQDAEGNWQFSDAAPKNVAAEMVMVETDLNRDLSPEYKASNKPLAKSSGLKVKMIRDSSTNETSTSDLLSPDKMKSLIGDAKNVQKLIDEQSAARREQLESIR
jgi:hypothetical protein